MFFYEVSYSITNRYDLNPLRVVGYVKCFTDEAKTIEFTQIPFSELGVNITYSDVRAATKEEVTANIEAVVLPMLETEDVQIKLQENYEIFTLGF
jgi:hypothetical protein